MAAPKGNQFWKARSSHGRKPKFANPDVLWAACKEYFQWVEDHPLWEMKPFPYQGAVIQEAVAKMRAMTLDGLCLFLDIEDDTWRHYRVRKGFLGVTTRVEKIIREQKLTGAAADLLNPNIIARDLGLADKQQRDIVLKENPEPISETVAWIDGVFGGDTEAKDKNTRTH